MLIADMLRLVMLSVVMLIADILRITEDHNTQY